MHEATEIHHQVPRRLLAAHDRVRAHTALNGEALQLWFEYEGLLLKFGLDPDLSRDELEQAIEASAVEVSYEEHRSRIHSADWPCWGRKAGLAILEHYVLAETALGSGNRLLRFRSDDRRLAYALFEAELPNGGASRAA